MSITEAILQDMWVQRQRDLMKDRYNAITSKEVEMKFDKVMAEIRALESYVSCFEREWNINLKTTRQSLEAYCSKINDEKIHFVNETYMTNDDYMNER